MMNVLLCLGLVLCVCVSVVFGANPTGCYGLWSCTATPVVSWTGSSNCPAVTIVDSNSLNQVLVYSNAADQLYSVAGSDGSSCSESNTFGPSCASNTATTRNDGITVFSDCASANPECGFTSSLPQSQLTTWNVDLALNPAYTCLTCVGSLPQIGFDIPFNDFTDFDLTAGQTYLDCAKSCAATAGCVAWAYSYPVGNPCGANTLGTDGHCWLKNAIANLGPSPCRVWGTPDVANECNVNKQAVPSGGFPGKRGERSVALQNLLNLNKTNPGSIPSNVWKMVL